MFFQKNWFVLGLLFISVLSVADGSGITIAPGKWLGQHHGPDISIFVIFVLSGLALDTGRIRDGLLDLRGTVLALLLIFIIAPLLALGFAQLPLAPGLIIGLFLVATMPTTLSSGVVMTGAAGGNIAHALLITIVANGMAVFTIPVILGMLLRCTGDTRAIVIEQLPIMLKIAMLVVLPLTAGILIRTRSTIRLQPVLPAIPHLNQAGILIIVWISMCAGREAIISGADGLVPVLISVALFHLLLVCAGLVLCRIFTVPKRRRESIILMGGQKTLALSVILQFSLFPEHGMALAVCVIHHIAHLVMDTFLVHYLKKQG